MCVHDPPHVFLGPRACRPRPRVHRVRELLPPHVGPHFLLQVLVQASALLGAPKHKRAESVGVAAMGQVVIDIVRRAADDGADPRADVRARHVAVE